MKKMYLAFLVLIFVASSCSKIEPKISNQNEAGWVNEPQPAGIFKTRPLFYGYPVAEPKCEDHNYSNIEGKLGFIRVEFAQDKDQYLLKWSRKVAGTNCSDKTKFDCYVSSEKKQKILAKSKVRKLEDMLKQLPPGEFKNNPACKACGSEHIIIGSDKEVEGHMYVADCNMGGPIYSQKLKQLIDFIQGLVQ